MAVNKLTPPKNLTIDFSPSAKQYKMWELLQPNYCNECGGEIEQVLTGYDHNNNQQYKPQCKKCGNRNLATSVLGGGAAGKRSTLPAYTVMYSKQTL